MHKNSLLINNLCSSNKLHIWIKIYFIFVLSSLLAKFVDTLYKKFQPKTICDFKKLEKKLIFLFHSGPPVAIKDITTADRSFAC